MEPASVPPSRNQDQLRWRRVQLVLKLLVGLTMICVVVGIGVRTWWVCSHTEGGWEILRDHLAAGLPPIVPVHPDGDEHPIEHAAHWMLAQCDRIASDPNSTAADCMGAAFTACTLTSNVWPVPACPPTAMLGSLHWSAALRTQDSTTDVRDSIRGSMYACLNDMAAKACELEPNCAAWWRLRATLTFFCRWQEDPSNFDVSLLEESKSHDPNNALYDYLLAYLYYRHATTSASPLYSNDAPSLLIRDYASFRRCVEYYRDALGKHFLSIGFDRFPVAKRFIGNSSGGVTDKLTFILCDLPWMLDSPIWLTIREPVWDGIKMHLAQQDFAGALSLWQRGDLRPVIQREAAGEVIVFAGQ
jgi:hypothetical protein